MVKKILEWSDFLRHLNPDASKVTLVGGCFDILHYGHLMFLQKAKDTGDILMIALESDEFIKKRKQRDPVHTQQQRAEILAGLSVVDIVINLPYFATHEEYSHMVQKIHPDVIAVTAGDSQLELKTKYAQEIGASVRVVCPLITDSSTSNIIKYASFFSN